MKCSQSIICLRLLLKDVLSLNEKDGYTKWRENEHKSLHSLVQRRLSHLQNPDNCETAKKLVCDLNKVSNLLILIIFIPIVNFSLFTFFVQQMP